MFYCDRGHIFNSIQHINTWILWSIQTKILNWSVFVIKRNGVTTCDLWTIAIKCLLCWSFQPTIKRLNSLRSQRSRIRWYTNWTSDSVIFHSQHNYRRCLHQEVHGRKDIHVIWIKRNYRFYKQKNYCSLKCSWLWKTQTEIPLKFYIWKWADIRVACFETKC